MGRFADDRPTRACQGTIPARSFPALTPVLDEWRAMLDRYCKEMNGEAPWWHNEQTAVGLLAAAIWRRDGVGIEEFAQPKRSGRRGERRKKGRCDLYFKIGRSAYYAEAKQIWMAADASTQRTKDRLEERLRTACDESLSVDARDGKHVGIVFAVPRVNVKNRPHSRTAREEIAQQLRGWLAAVKTLPRVAMAWYLIADARRSTMATVRGATHYYPGVVVVLGVRRTKKSR